ncbi:MAG: Uma2 family endonuclease [Candidatus Thermochlorobacter aerophilum]|uniref:Uma2 family endonuclease n=1 Tax=Candidatus Thermochlorobacter aerophilus TaxID=1868324 RepID=A0A395M3G6_9BACT|nr:MAG: Uma2 family endonuclease [Candidatus Thermochlorobacter aerophilum]
MKCLFMNSKPPCRTMQVEARLEPVIVRRKITVKEYDQMYEAGIFQPDERLELINGEIVKMPPMNAPHIAYVAILTELLVKKLAQRAIIFTQLPIVLNDDSEPEPDISVLKWKKDRYFSGKPTAREVYLLIEVASASLVYDREVKLPLYARARIPEVWILKVQDQQLEVYRHPKDGSYAEQRLLQPSDKIAPLAFPDIEITLSDIFIMPDT